MKDENKDKKEDQILNENELKEANGGFVNNLRATPSYRNQSKKDIDKFKNLLV